METIKKQVSNRRGGDTSSLVKIKMASSGGWSRKSGLVNGIGGLGMLKLLKGTLVQKTLTTSMSILISTLFF